jgi:hypothetical protein
MRHGFNQTQAFIYTLKKAVLENSLVVGQVGLSKSQIVQGFFGRLSTIYEIAFEHGMIIYLFIIFAIGNAIRNKKFVFD